MNIATALVGFTIALAGPCALANSITNGDFETGNFAGWKATSTQTSSFQASLNDGHNSAITNNAAGQPAWYVRNVAANYFSSPATPISGYSAFNSFDGYPGHYDLSQQFTVGSGVTSASLSFAFGWQDDYFGENRVLSVDILNAAGTAVLDVPYSFTLPQGSNSTWTIDNVVVDVTSVLNTLGAGTYTLQFDEFVPGNYTGPAQFAIDNIALNVTSSDVPEPASLGLLGLGLAGLAALRRRKTQ